MYADASDEDVDESSTSRRSASRRPTAQPQINDFNGVAEAATEIPPSILAVPPAQWIKQISPRARIETGNDISNKPTDQSVVERRMSGITGLSPRIAPMMQSSTADVVRIQSDVFPPARSGVCNGEKDHLSMACHLFPRLSETNLQFHDISWNHEELPNGDRRAILRKRMVKVCALLKVGSIRAERRGTVAAADFDVSLCLVDGRPRADNQIVSNRHMIVVPLQTTTRLSFLARPAHTVIVRSNYAQPEVRLRIAMRRRSDGLDMGAVELALLDSAQRPSWQSGGAPRSHIFGGKYRMNFELTDFPTRQAQMQADFLPDVLICDEGWAGVLACYRQMTCEIVARNRESSPYSTMISDLVLVTLPRIMDDRQLVETFIRLLIKERILTSGGDLTAGSQPISAVVARFRALYLCHVLPAVLSVEAGQSTVEDLTTVAFGQRRCTPLTPDHFMLHLAGSHALD